MIFKLNDCVMNLFFYLFFQTHILTLFMSNTRAACMYGYLNSGVLYDTGVLNDTLVTIQDYVTFKHL